MLSVSWKIDAQDDLAEIIDTIEQRNESAASELHATIVQAAENLLFMPYFFAVVVWLERGNTSYIQTPFLSIVSEKKTLRYCVCCILVKSILENSSAVTHKVFCDQRKT